MPTYQPRYQQSRALIIGIDEYPHLNAMPLATAVKGAYAVADLLEADYAFTVTRLFDSQATKSAILAALEALTQTAPDDRVLIYFAGHGLTRQNIHGGELGYLAAHDTSANEWTTALKMDDVTEQAQLIPAKHILYVLDTCFGGLALGTRAVGSERMLEDLLLRRSLQVIAAGKANQEVTDRWGVEEHSIFTGLFLEGLRGAAASPRGLLTGRRLGQYLEEQVGIHTASRQTPQYGPLLGGEGGDFIFREAGKAQLPAYIRNALESPVSDVRLGIIPELKRLAAGPDAELAGLARFELQKLSEEDDSSIVRGMAVESLTGIGKKKGAEARQQSKPAPLTHKQAEANHPTLGRIVSLLIKVQSIAMKTLGWSAVWSLNWGINWTIFSISIYIAVGVATKGFNWILYEFGMIILRAFGAGAFSGSLGGMLAGLVTLFILRRAEPAIRWKQIWTADPGWAIGSTLIGLVSGNLVYYVGGGNRLGLSKRFNVDGPLDLLFFLLLGTLLTWIIMGMIQGWRTGLAVQRADSSIQKGQVMDLALWWGALSTITTIAGGISVILVFSLSYGNPIIAILIGISVPLLLLLFYLIIRFLAWAFASP